MLNTAQPKPRKRAAVKRAAKRVASKVIQRVRALCVIRDGACRIHDWEHNPDDWHSDDLHPCDAFILWSEWAHLGDKKRCKTRGRPPEERHTTADSLMLCSAHHHQYDTAHTLAITPLTERGADGPLRFEQILKPTTAEADAHTIRYWRSR